ncbi:PIN domain-containing protein [Algoriphagus sp. A40]|uniref:type II toxin-antitoxin system VapC family toxin n=1 Tax=Algoriphagus sp. A40 TaxID=1945863 RepID=UPI000985D6E5|nr:PIN domain-containing protein [Algoriphagus sp. A40]OOG75353.1 twitching motility protein PilT [Algoriphagus sp. A40]
MKRVFLDTNVILDLLAERKPFYQSIASVATLADRKELLLFTSPISFTTIDYVMSKFEPKESVLIKLQKFAILCKVADANQETIDKSLFSLFSDFEDAVQYQCALQAGCDLILTRNGNDFRKSTLPVMTAEEFLNSIRN